MLLAYPPSAHEGVVARPKASAHLTTMTPTMTPSQAVDGMRKAFVRVFGHGWVARRLARASWIAFRAALLAGAGIALARIRAVQAAEDRNMKTLLVARWSSHRIERTVYLAVQTAANNAH